jgi:hypothetical protein
MRATESMGVLAQTSDGKWAQTAMSEVLRSGSPKSLRDLAIFYADEWHSRGFGTLDETVRTGEPAMERLYGDSYFEFFRKHPVDSEHFNRAMSAFSNMDAPAVVAAYDFGGISSMVDVGGGYGALLSAVLERNPSMQGTLYDLPQVIQGLHRSEHGRLNPAIAHRIRLIEGDMFQSVPPGAAAYSMKRILHDWPDDLCRKLLANCRAGVQDGGKLIVIDAVVPTGGSYSPAKIMDLTMMLLGGKERTEAEFRELFEASGWKLTGVTPTASHLSVVEGAPV